MTGKLFICPKCGKDLFNNGKSLVCEDGHCYDIAKSGYVNLILANKKNSANPGDNKEMTDARKRVMSKNYYAALAESIASKLVDPTVIIDAGCGTGYIPNIIKQRFKEAEVIGSDISKSAIETASKAYKNIDFSVASSKNLPIKSLVADAVVCAFAPVYNEEFLRVTKPGGLLLRVTPAKEHLFKLKSFLYNDPRYNEEDETEFFGYEIISDEVVKSDFCGDKEDIKALVKMTPYYYHTSEEILEKLNSVDELCVNTEFRLKVFRKI